MQEMSFDVFQKAAIKSKLQSNFYSVLLLKKFTRQVSMRDESELIDVLSKVDLYYLNDDEASEKIIRDFSSYLPSKSSEILIKKFLQHYLGHIDFSDDGNSRIPVDLNTTTLFLLPKTEEAFKKLPLDLRKKACEDKSEPLVASPPLKKRCEILNFL
jgi:hypothetical protein